MRLRTWLLAASVLACVSWTARAEDAATAPDSPPANGRAAKKDKDHWKHVTLKDLAPKWTSDLYKPLPAPDPLTQAQLDKLYDNQPSQSSDGTPVPAFPKQLKPDFVISNGQLSSASLTYKPSGTTLEMGVLGGPDEPNSLLAPSPYLNLKQTADSQPESWVDYHVAAQAAFLQMYARYFNTELSPDPETAALANQLGALPPSLLPGGQNLPSLLSYNDGYQATNMVVTSALAQVGRAYTLFGPVDFGWTTGFLADVVDVFPHGAGDLSAGPRVNLGGGRSVIVSGGMTEDVSPAATDIIQQYLATGQPELGLNLQAAPHAEVTYSGALPGLSGVKLNATLMRQWSSQVIGDQMRASLSADVAGRPTEVGFTYRNDNGPAIEYQRLSSGVDVTRGVADGVSATVGYQRDNFTYGNANLSNAAVTAGVKIDLDKAGGNGSAEIKENFNPQYTANNSQTTGAFSQFTNSMDNSVSQVLDIAEQGEALLHLSQSPDAGNPGDDPQRMQALANTIGGLPPATQEAYKTALLASASGNSMEQQFINELFTGNNLQAAAAGLNQGAAVLTLLGNEQVLENFVNILLRSEMVDYFNSISFQIPIINAEVHWSPAVMIAAAQALSMGPAPLQPLTADNEQSVLQPWIQQQIATGAGLPANATPQQIANALLASAPPAVQAQLAAGGAQAVTALVNALSDQIRLQFNEMMIEVILAGEQLNRLTVDGGRQLGDLDHSALQSEFQKLDARKDRAHEILEGAMARLKAEQRS